MMTIAAVLEACETDDERRVLLGIIERMNARPAVVVTVDLGGTKRRYVVATEDESIFAGAPDGPFSDGRPFYFGAQWLRGFGKVDEMYRSFGLYEATKVERFDRKKVWG